MLYFFFDGTSQHLSYFDELQREEGYRAVVEMPAKQMASSHAMKRFFRAFAIFHAGAFRWVLQELFLWRLRREKMRVVMLTLDTMVMDNDEALQREGCDPTYKKVKGFQPLQLIWEGKIVDAIFRRGKRHSNYGRDVEKMIRGIVSLIRTRYDASVSIIVRLDAGFFDEKNFALFDDLGIGFLATGKVYDAIKEKVQAIPKKKWKEYDNERQVWSYACFSYQCESWKKAYRALYTRPQYDDQQRLLVICPTNKWTTRIAYSIFQVCLRPSLLYCLATVIISKFKNGLLPTALPSKWPCVPVSCWPPLRVNPITRLLNSWPSIAKP
jgi:hypothetical protein